MLTDKKSITEFNIAPFALPNCAPDELRFEEPRDINRVVVTFESNPTGEIRLSYQRNTWPERRIEKDYRGVDNALTFGWGAIDDWFNTPWHEASTIIHKINDRSFEITFKGLSAEIPESTDYDVTFRRTNGLKIDSDAKIENIEVYTRWKPVVATLEVRLDCGKKTVGECIDVSGYNAVIESMYNASDRTLTVGVLYVKPDLEYSFDSGIVSFDLGHDKFSISLRSLDDQGPIWYEEEGIFIKWADASTSFEDYLKSIAGKKTYSEEVAATYDQGLGGSMYGQPRAHPTALSIGCKYARQRFWVEYNGDIVLTKWNMDWAKMCDTPRYKNEADGRLFFGLERWRSMGRFSDPAPVLAQNDHFHKDGIVLEQKSFAVPLIKSISEPLVADDSIIALLRFRFRNESLAPVVAEIPIEYSSKSERSSNRWGYSHWHKGSTDYLVPTSEREKLTITKNSEVPSLALAVSKYNDQEVIRFALDTGMEIVETENGLILSKKLEPGESCEALLKAPYIVLDTDDELKALDNLAFDQSYKELREFWIDEAAKGAQLYTPEARLNDLYRTYISHIMSADVAMNDEPYLVNTSVGSSTYGNFTNESVMIMQELDERGLHEEVRRRLSVYLKYQGQIGLKGNFTDHDGVFFAAGGFEHGDSYSQHHGWALWHFAEHYFMTRDDKWLGDIADQLIKGVEWVFRQRRNTMTRLPHSRGWEHGFIPAASLEDVTDYFYWLTPNTVSWKGVDRVTAALEAINHPEAGRLRKEADEFRTDLIKGYETARQHSPIVRLRNGKWVPHYPSRLYVRGRDVGWIREILEGSVYLLILGLYDPNSKQGKWIVDDFQDNRYLSNNYGYPIPNLKECWFDFGGFSCQPNLLPGLMPHLDRDEPELYIWMYFNAFAATYREETNVMVEHPHPILGHSNSAWVKTSDMANSMKWLRYMFVYAPDDELYIGRAIPREWLTSTKPIGVKGAATKQGDISAIYTAYLAAKSIKLEADLDLRQTPVKISARFRHPEKLPIVSVKVNGEAWTKFDPEKDDVDITGLSGMLTIEAYY